MKEAAGGIDRHRGPAGFAEENVGDAAEALPQLSTSSPALFQMRMRTSAMAEGSRTISWYTLCRS